jgi:GT2 family glycosyltransferase
MGAMTPSIDAVIVVYNRYELTDSCLRHLAAQSLAHNLIVVDNGSTDDTRARIAEDWPGARLVCFDDNRGFAEACNRGVAAGSAKIVVLLNNDVECLPDFLEAIVEPLESDPRCGSVASLMLQPGGQTIDSFGLSADSTLAGFPRLHGHPAAHAADPPAGNIAGPAGTAAAYRREAWEQLGGLDESIFAYLEDFDLALRLRSAGWSTDARADASGIHLGSATHGHRSAWQRRHGGFARGYLLRRYAVLRGRAAARTLATELIVVLADAFISRDLAALRGRLEGWRAGRTHPRLPPPAAEAIDETIGFRDSLALRRGVYARGAG